MFKNLPSFFRLFTFFTIGIGLGLYAVTSSDSEAAISHVQAERLATVSTTYQADSSWTVGQLRPNGLRIKPSGPNDASHVLDPSQFMRPEVRKAYTIAQKIPAMINKLYCWCGCENRGVHRSNLGCFEDKMAINCGVCRGTAEIAYKMMQEGETDARKIQAAVDMEWGPDWAKQEQRNRR